VRRVPAGVTLRPATARDAPAASRTVALALGELFARQGREAPDVHPHDAVYRHLAGDGVSSFWVAEAAPGVVGFSVGMRRSGLWFLGGLFVLPEWQGRGLGQALLERAEDSRSTDGVAAVLSSASNELSNRLYARRGMAPLLPVLQMTGPVPLRHAPDLPSGLRATSLGGSERDLGALLEIDDRVLGIDRSPDHRWLLGDEARSGWLFERRGRPAAYAYLGGDGTEGGAVVGPAAAVRPSDIAPVVAFALAELAATGVASGGVMVPGGNLAVQRMLWDDDFQFHGATGLLGATRPFGLLDRYVFAGNALM
jgi:GNAT superfamily N-acetyltransferase